MSMLGYIELSAILPATTTAAVKSELQQQVAVFQQQLSDLLATADLAAPALQQRLQWQYQVPELGEGGACSLFGQVSGTTL